jgi:GTP-binding protein HflX
VLHVVDGSHADPVSQIGAVREVLTEIGAADVPEIIVVNKADVADPLTIKTLLSREPRAVVVSARTGAGIDELRATMEASLPQPDIAVEVLVPYERGDLVSRVHSEGSVDSLEHTGEGTLLAARVHGDLAGELAPFAR